MGLMDFLKGQLIEVISWLDDSQDTLCWRFPHHDNAIKMGAKLTVREGQAAIFVSKGKIADVFGPGLYALRTDTLPFVTALENWPYGFESPFKAEVYFVSTRQYQDMKWGTTNPITLRDPDFGIVRARAHGVYAIEVVEPALFFKTYVGTDGRRTTEEIEGQLRQTLVSAFTDALGAAKLAVLDLAGNYARLADGLRAVMDAEFRSGGIALRKFVVSSVSLPPEVEKAIDARSSMGAIGNLGAFTQYQAAEALRDAAQNQGGAGAIMGLGVASLAAGQLAALGAPQPGGAPVQSPAPPLGGTPEPQFRISGIPGQPGPVPLSQAAALIRASLGKRVLVWTQGMAAWAPWQEVAALAAEVGPAEPPPPPPTI